MAKDTTGQPWVFDAAGQFLELGELLDENEGHVGNRILIQPFVSYINISAGAAGGVFEVLESEGGRSLTGSITLAANAHERVTVNRRVNGIYIDALADGTISVYHGRDF